MDQYLKTGYGGNPMEEAGEFGRAADIRTDGG